MRYVLALLAALTASPAAAICLPDAEVAAGIASLLQVGARGKITVDPEQVKKIIAAVDADTPGRPEGPPITRVVLIVMPKETPSGMLIGMSKDETCMVLTGPAAGIIKLYEAGAGPTGIDPGQKV